MITITKEQADAMLAVLDANFITKTDFMHSCRVCRGISWKSPDKHVVHSEHCRYMLSVNAIIAMIES